MWDAFVVALLLQAPHAQGAHYFRPLQWIALLQNSYELDLFSSWVPLGTIASHAQLCGLLVASSVISLSISSSAIYSNETRFLNFINWAESLILLTTLNSENHLRSDHSLEIDASLHILMRIASSVGEVDHSRCSYGLFYSPGRNSALTDHQV